MKYLTPLIITGALAMTACAQQSECDADAVWEQGRMSGISEARIAVLAGLVRELTGNGARYPDPALFRTVVQQRFASDDPDQDVMRDGWGRPFVYQVGADGRSWKIYSLGANGVDDKGSGDDSPSRGGEISG